MDKTKRVVLLYVRWNTTSALNTESQGWETVAGPVPPGRGGAVPEGTAWIHSPRAKLMHVPQLVTVMAPFAWVSPIRPCCHCRRRRSWSDQCMQPHRQPRASALATRRRYIRSRRRRSRRSRHLRSHPRRHRRSRRRRHRRSRRHRHRRSRQHC